MHCVDGDALYLERLAVKSDIASLHGLSDVSEQDWKSDDTPGWDSVAFALEMEIASVNVQIFVNNMKQ